MSCTGLARGAFGAAPARSRLEDIVFLDRWIESFNEGRFDEALADVTDDYVYVDPSSGPLDAVPTAA